jgi:hypothetical protein
VIAAIQWCAGIPPATAGAGGSRPRPINHPGEVPVRFTRSEPPDEFGRSGEPRRPGFDRVFAADRADDILAAYESDIPAKPDHIDLARSTAAAIRAKSPSRLRSRSAGSNWARRSTAICVAALLEGDLVL